MKKIFTISAIILIAFSTFAEGKSSAVKLYEKGLVSQSREKWFEASECFQQAVEANPSFGDAWFHLAQVSYELNDFNLSLSYLDTAEKFSKGAVNIQNLRGFCLVSLNRLQEAKTIFEEVLKTNPNDVESRFGLAEISLYDGSFEIAKGLYQDALKRQVNNRKALLALAVLSAENENYEKAQEYINQAMRHHSNDATVHYLAAYLNAKQGKIPQAEKNIRSALQIKGDYIKAYVFLGNLLYSQNRYAEVIDIADYLISVDRNTVSAWYLKGISQYKSGKIDEAIDTWATALEIDPNDEIMRTALELLVNENVPVEDERRLEWSGYHVQKAGEFAKLFLGEEARYEYQRALRIDPSNLDARIDFAETISKMRLNELYLNQLKFIQNLQKNIDEKTLSQEEISRRRKMQDTIESYEALMKYSLNTKWDIDPFYLDKTRWNIGIYCKKNAVNLIHADAEEIATLMAADIFSGVATTAITVQNKSVSGFSEAFALARSNKLDYFVVLSLEETERDIALDATMYSGRTGTETKKISLFRTGNDKFAALMRSFRRSVLNTLSVRGKMIKRSGNEVLVDLGKSEGLVPGTVLNLIKAGSIKTVDRGPGVMFDQKNFLGYVTVKEVGEEISSGTLSQSGFYDRANIGDEVTIESIPQNVQAEPSDTVPVADSQGKTIPISSKSARELGLIRTPPVIDLIHDLSRSFSF